jgi:hypothetical protein
MISEHADGTLSSIALVDAWGDKLEVGMVGMHKFFE